MSDSPFEKEFPDHAGVVDAGARAMAPHLFNGKFEESLNRSSLFTPEQAAEGAENQRNKTRQQIADVLAAVGPRIAELAWREGAQAAWEETECGYNFEGMGGEFPRPDLNPYGETK